MVAAENGILAARAMLGAQAVPPTVVIRVDTPGRSTIVMQPIDKPICLDIAGKVHDQQLVPIDTGDAAI
jgi:hypothetical protein